MTRPLDAIFFDIDDTLFCTSVFAEQARLAAVDAMLRAGLQSTQTEALQELHDVIAEFSSNYGNHFDKVLDRLGPDCYAGHNRAVIVAAGVIAYHDTKWNQLEVWQDATEVLAWLAGKPVIRGIISAGITVKQAEKIVRLGVLDYLTPTAIFFTDQVGFSKPNPKLYRRVLEQLGLRSERCLYVGDNPTHDIDPCNRDGWNTVRLRRGGRCADLEGETRADYEIANYHELRDLLERDFSLGG